MNNTNNVKIKNLLINIVSVIYLGAVLALSIWVCIHRNELTGLGAYGYGGVFLLCFISNASVLLPAPGLMVVLSASLIMNKYLVALISALGISLGEMVGFYCGRTGRRMIGDDKKEHKILEVVQKYDFLAVFIFAFIPVGLFDLAGLAAGYIKMNTLKFYIACFLGKFLKCLIVVLSSEYIVNILENVYHITIG